VLDEEVLSNLLLTLLISIRLLEQNLIKDFKDLL